MSKSSYNELIDEWLSTIPSPTPLPTGSKRPAPLTELDLNVMNGRDASPSKRRKLEGTQDIPVDGHVTPRPPGQRSVAAAEYVD